MSDSLINVEIDLLARHPELPGADKILERFAEHHAQSEARRRAHDQLMHSDSNLDLEDFGALAASALGSSESHESVLGEGTASFDKEEFNDGDTLPEQEAAPEPSDASDAQVEAQDDAESPAENVEDESAQTPTEDEETQEENLAKDEEAKQPQGSSSKKRTRKRKKKK